MKAKFFRLILLAVLGFALQGCIAFPPLIQVEHKEGPPNQDLVRRLDAIDHRLDTIDHRLDAVEPKKQ